MTPTLRGRRHTRLLLALLVGVPVTLPFCLVALFTVPFSAPVPYVMLAVVVAVGLARDGRYDREQRQRWDHDWPVHRQLSAGLVEFALSMLVLFGPCGGVFWLNPGFLVLFPLHYLLVWGIGFLLVQGPLQVLLPRWRFHGGELGRPRRRLTTRSGG